MGGPAHTGKALSKVAAPTRPCSLFLSWWLSLVVLSLLFHGLLFGCDLLPLGLGGGARCLPRSLLLSPGKCPGHGSG
jgi:hypothetical protein